MYMLRLAVLVSGCLVFFGALSSCASSNQTSLNREADLEHGAELNLCPAQTTEYKSPVNPVFEKMSLGELSALADRRIGGAMVALGLRYTPGYDVPGGTETPATDLKKATNLFEAAAKSGDSEAEFLLGVAFLDGAVKPKDEKQAAYWFSRSAKHGSVAGQFWTGELIAKGRGGKAPAWKKALRYFRAAAEGGWDDAFVELGYAYFEGYGIDKDAQKAAFCFRKVLRSPRARYNLRLLIDQRRVSWQEGDPGAPPSDLLAPPST